MSQADSQRQATAAKGTGSAVRSRLFVVSTRILGPATGFTVEVKWLSLGSIR